MSTIKAIQIQGIRSFGPEKDDKQQVVFYSPLTLIVGQNGCGKTTVIECLKYITAGELPPGCGRGASFVHDPKLAMESQIYGQVRLLFKSADGKEIEACRSLEVTQKHKKLEVKTLDATYTKRRPDGSRGESISSKCAEFEVTMADFLAVSKPVLENVIFCHQEDSSWPLDEGKKVKDKFDAIFNATRYIKCLDNIKKLRKSMKEEVKVMDQLLSGLKLWKAEADDKRKCLKEKEDSLVKLRDKKKQLQDDMVPICERLNEIKKIENSLNEIKLSHLQKKGKLENLRTAQEELRAGQSEEFTCSDMELRLMIQDFQQDLEKKERELRRVESDSHQIARDIKENLKEIEKVRETKTNLEFASKNHVSQVKERNRVLENVTKDYGFSDFFGIQQFDDEKVKSLLAHLEGYVADQYQIILTKKKDFEKQENEIQSEIDDLRKREAALEQEILTKEKQREDSKVKQRRIKQELEQNELEYSASSLNEVKQQLAQVEEEIKKQEGKLNIETVREEIEGIRRLRSEVEHRLEDKKRIVNKMNRQAQARSKLDIHMQEKESLENKVQFMKRRHKDEFEHMFGEIPEENIKNKLDAYLNSSRQQSAELREEKENLNRKKTMLDTRVENHKNMIKKKEEEVRGVEEKVTETCQGQELEKALEKSKEQKEQLTKERGDLSSSIQVLNRFIERLKEDDCCPLCHRDFGTKEDVEMLIQELEDKVKRVPQKLSEAKKKLEKEEKMYEKMVALKPLKDQANAARVMLDKMKEEMEADRKEIETLKNGLESNSELLQVTSCDEETASSVHSDVVMMDNHLRKIKQLKEQIEDLRASLGGGEGDLTMEEAMKQQSDLEEEIKNYRRQESDLQDRLEEYKSELEALKDRKLRLSTKELEMKTKLQETESLKEELKKLESERVTIEEELEKAKEDVAPFKYQIEKKMGEKKRKTTDKEKWVDSENAKLQTVRQDQKLAKDLQSSIQEYIRSGKEELLKESRQKLTQLDDTSVSLDARKKMLEDDQRQLDRELNNQKTRKRNLDDEKKIREKEEEAKKLQEEINSIKSSIRDKDETGIRDEKNQLNVQYEEMYSECAKIDGSSRTITDEVKKLREDLARKEFRDAEVNYKNKYFEKKCTDIAIDDLDKYYSALDSAIMRFHSDKMHTINAIIRDLWRTTYKGNDIDFIEIKTDESVSQGADKRRTYNYRVVMVKNGTEMDMRGRCSAGQKVLASLIIRMALAETFSLNCGVLALDEPTTNLDAENIEALASALLNIVEKRRHQKNFQLVVITHDMEFLQKLAMRDYIDYYYKVSRNERGLSTIRRMSADTL